MALCDSHAVRHFSLSTTHFDAFYQSDLRHQLELKGLIVLAIKMQRIVLAV